MNHEFDLTLMRIGDDEYVLILETELLHGSLSDVLGQFAEMRMTSDEIAALFEQLDVDQTLVKRQEDDAPVTYYLNKGKISK